MRLRTLIIALTVLIVSAGATVALACPGCMGPGWRGGPGWSALTPEQQKNAEDMRIDFLKKTERIRTQINEKRLELMELSRKSNPDQKAMDKAEQELWSLQDAMRNEYRTFDRKLAGILPPEHRQGFGYDGSRGYGPRYCGWMGGPGCSWDW